jgi:multifunctional methyltransferase subunit TRM112
VDGRPRERDDDALPHAPSPHVSARVRIRLPPTFFSVPPHRPHRTMKLLTHNMLMSPGTKNGYPLAIEVEKMEEVEAEFSAEFMVRMVEKVDYPALLATVASLNVESGLPAAVPAKFAEDETFLQALHHVLMEIEIVDGQLVCPETSKKFPVKDGIPSLM